MPTGNLSLAALPTPFRDILDSLAAERPPSPSSPLVLITDDKPDYSRVLDRHPLVFVPRIRITASPIVRSIANCLVRG